jgi:hypothetical protein
MSGKLINDFICNFHVLSHLLLIYICQLHWNPRKVFLLWILFYSVFFSIGAAMKSEIYTRLIYKMQEQNRFTQSLLDRSMDLIRKDLKAHVSSISSSKEIFLKKFRHSIVAKFSCAKDMYFF